MTKNTVTLPKNNEREITITSQVIPWMTRIAYFLADKLIFPWFFRKIQITGQENVPKNGAVIIAPTHRSRWDALIVPYATGRTTSGRDPHFISINTLPNSSFLKSKLKIDK